MVPTYLLSMRWSLVVHLVIPDTTPTVNSECLPHFPILYGFIPSSPLYSPSLRPSHHQRGPYLVSRGRTKNLIYLHSQRRQLDQDPGHFDFCLFLSLSLLPFLNIPFSHIHLSLRPPFPTPYLTPFHPPTSILPLLPVSLP